MSEAEQEEPLVIIKKYANRRLYNTETSVYITLEELRLMVKEGRNFQVVDAKSGDDLTRSTLAQIIYEQETKGFALLPTDFLRHVICYYDDGGGGVSDVLQHYLNASMDSFSQNQERMRSLMDVTKDGLFPTGQVEEMARQNIALLEKAFSMFNPFTGYPADGQFSSPASNKNKKK